jgi:hypothetical protein
MTIARHESEFRATPPTAASAVAAVNTGSNQSGWSYIVDRLIDQPGQSYVSLAHGRPAHLSPRSIEALCYSMAKLGILEKQGKGGSAMFRVARDGLDRVPSGWRHEGLPGNGQFERNKAAASKPAAVARLAPEARAPLSPVKGKPVELHDDAPVLKPGGHFQGVDLKTGGASPEALQLAAKVAAEKAYTEATIILIVGETPRRFPISVAKSLYRQLKDIFE